MPAEQLFPYFGLKRMLPAFAKAGAGKFKPLEMCFDHQPCLLVEALYPVLHINSLMTQYQEDSSIGDQVPVNDEHFVFHTMVQRFGNHTLVQLVGKCKAPMTDPQANNITRQIA